MLQSLVIQFHIYFILKYNIIFFTKKNIFFPRLCVSKHWNLILDRNSNTLRYRSTILNNRRGFKFDCLLWKTTPEIAVTTKKILLPQNSSFFLLMQFFFFTRPVLNQTTFFVVCFVTNLLTNFVTVIKHISFLKTGGCKNQSMD